MNKITFEERFEKLSNNLGLAHFTKFTIKKFLKDELERYTTFLEKNGYTDDDVWCEEKTAVDRFLKEKL
jgi:hypothetical protein